MKTSLTIVLVIAGVMFCACLPKRMNKNENAASGTIRLNEADSIQMGNVLIVYYSLSGKTREIAEIISRQTGGTLYRIETVKTFSSISVIHALEAKKELDSGNLPELSITIPDVSGYDLIIVGSPTWRHTITTPVVSFLEQCDFKGKKVAAYATNKGNVGTFFELFSQKVKNAVLLTGEEFHNNLSGKNELNRKISA